VIDQPAGAATPRRRFRRIVLAVDTTSADLTAMERAAVLAARLQGELMALFVEDIDLVRLAEHRQIFAFSTVLPAGRQLAADNLKDALRLQAARLRRAVEQAAARQRVKCAFQVRQGRLLAEVLSTAHDDDLVVISWAGDGQGAPWASSTPLPAAAAAQALAEARAHSVLLLHPSAAVGPVLVAFDGSEAARHGLALAAQVADLDGAVIDVLLLASRIEEAEQWGADIVASLAETRISVTLLHVPRAGLQTLTETAAQRRSSLLVLNAARALAEGETGRRLLQRMLCSVLLVR
jgi:nucleotide-binding universal stress UspA family protein